MPEPSTRSPKRLTLLTAAAITLLVLLAVLARPRLTAAANPPTDFDPAPGWSFNPAADTFSADSLFDLRPLNETIAGDHGFIKRSPDGMSFARGDGQPIRFWGGADYVQGNAYGNGPGQEALAHHARFLAKRGVNIVRFHGSLEPKKEGSAITDVDESILDQAFRLVAAMKREGIYTIISPYWGESAKVLKSWHVPSAGTDDAAGLLFLDETMQKGYKSWTKALYTRPNPYTGIALKDDPAVALIQLQNEDSLLFWTAQEIKGDQMLALRRKFGAFVKAKYGSSRGLPKAWSGASLGDDDWAHDLPAMQITWYFTREARTKTSAAMQVRISDEFEFLTKLMRDFNADMARYLRDDLGCKQLINDGNWRTADQAVMDDAERWSYTAGDVIATNHYFEAVHKGTNDGWQIIKDQHFSNASALTDPENMSLNVRQVQGMPFIVSEGLWVPPDLYQAESPLLVAGQSCLTGLDTFFWFCDGATEWDQAPEKKWTYATPMVLGQFPGAALVFRKALVKEAAPVVVEEKSLDDLWTRRMQLLAEGVAWDPNRDKGDLPKASSVKTTVDPLAFVAGPVWVHFGGDPAKSRVADLSQLIDRNKKIVRSATGEIELDYARGIYRVNAPQAQGVAGFLKSGGPQNLADVRIDLQNNYGAVTAISMDDAPLAESKKVLVQIATVARPQGWKVQPETFDNDKEKVNGFRIVDQGKGPWRIEKANGTLFIKNPHLTRAQILDPNGLPAGEIPIRQHDDGTEITLPPDALYMILE